MDDPVHLEGTIQEKGLETKGGLRSQQDSLERMKAIREGLTKEMERQRQLENQSFERSKAQAALLKNEINMRQQALQTTKDQLKTEQAKHQSLAVQFALLSKAEQKELLLLPASGVAAGSSWTTRAQKAS